ncbi:MAG: hypothetical protein FWG71_04510, partial [Synergistaceae bacterium]|nr:hypothetical protein [Synergistaceae bacterium]
MKKKFVFRIILALFFCVAVTCAGPARAAIIEPDPDLQRVMGDLYALSVAMRLYYDDTRNTQCPDQNDLARYLKKPLPDDWPAGYRTFVIQNDWWAGRKIPEFSAARKFLRENAPLLGLYDQTSRSAWLGGEFVWINALSFKEEPENPVFKVAPGEGDDSLYLFFNSPGTDYYWRSGLIYTDEARAEALR